MLELQPVIIVKWKLMTGNACNTLALCIMGSLVEETWEKMEFWVETVGRNMLEFFQLHPRGRN